MCETHDVRIFYFFFYFFDFNFIEKFFSMLKKWLKRHYETHAFDEIFFEMFFHIVVEICNNEIMTKNHFRHAEIDINWDLKQKTKRYLYDFYIQMTDAFNDETWNQSEILQLRKSKIVKSLIWNISQCLKLKNILYLYDAYIQFFKNFKRFACI